MDREVTLIHLLILPNLAAVVISMKQHMGIRVVDVGSRHGTPSP